MGVSTLNGQRATSARVQIPAWGCWYADVTLDGDHTLSGAATLKIADLTLTGTILTGGPVKGRSTYKIVAGAGGWGESIAAEKYADDAGVKLSKVVGDAARAAGETVGTLSSTTRIGPHWTRPADAAAWTLNRLAPKGWYVDEAGVTQIGARAASTLPSNVTRVQQVDLARGVAVLASESIAGILPGVVVDGLTAVDVQHEIDAKGLLRSTVWGTHQGVDGALDEFRKLLDVVDPGRRFRSTWEYRVVTRNGKKLNLQPVLRSSGMPDLPRVRVRPGAAGWDAEVPLGSLVVVGFLNEDPARPYVAQFEDPDGEGFVPATTIISEGSAYLARVGDSVTITPAQFAASGASNGAGAVTLVSNITATITSGSTKVKCG